MNYCSDYWQRVLILGMVSIAENVGAKKKPTYKAVIKINVNIPCVG